MRSPRFWHKPRATFGLRTLLFAPLVFAWRVTALTKRAKSTNEKLPVPIICLGNITVGGTGATSTTIAVQALLAKKGVQAHILSRAKRGATPGPIRVDERNLTAEHVGDGPLLMAAFGPVWVAKDLRAGAMAAIKSGAKMILLTDGFRQNGVQVDLAIILVDAAKGFGNGRVIPAGPLFGKLASLIERAQMTVSIGSANDQKTLRENWPELAQRPLFQASLQPLQTGMDWQGLKVIAFTGIGQPASFFQTLRAQDANIIASHEFADHSIFSTAVLKRLKSEAQKKSAQLVTTEKDAARLPAHFRREVITLPVRLKFDDEAAFVQTLMDAL